MTHSAEPGPGPDELAVHVHVASVAPAAAGQLAPAPGPRRTIRSVAHTVTFAAGDTQVADLLPRSPKRRRALVIARSGIGGGANSASYGWIGTNRSDVAAKKGLYVTGGGTFIAIELYGHDAWYALIDPAATAALSIAVVSEYED